jgi:hypothetical protein
VTRWSLSDNTLSNGKPTQQRLRGGLIEHCPQGGADKLARSEATSSPTKLREACEDVAKRLRVATGDARNSGAAMKLFDKVWQATTQ